MKKSIYIIIDAVLIHVLWYVSSLPYSSSGTLWLHYWREWIGFCHDGRDQTNKQLRMYAYRLLVINQHYVFPSIVRGLEMWNLLTFHLQPNVNIIDFLISFFIHAYPPYRLYFVSYVYFIIFWMVIIYTYINADKYIMHHIMHLLRPIKPDSHWFMWGNDDL